MSDDLGDQIAVLHDKIDQLSGMLERTHRVGTVTEVDYSDASKPRVRIGVGVDENGEPVKGPWVPVASHAGDRLIHAPVTVGQQMLQIAPDGNFENGLLLHYGFSNQKQSPSTSETDHVDLLGDVKTTITKDNHVREVKKVKITQSADGIMMEHDGTKFMFSKDGYKQTGGKMMHDDLNVGSSHKHTDVEPGSGLTGVPQAG